MNDELIGNLTTIIKCILIAILPATVLQSGDTNQLTTVITFVLSCAFAYLDSKYPNTFKVLGNAPQEAAADTPDALNEDYIYPLNDVDDSDEDGC